MKKLWIVRHAKSSWSDFSLPDHDRPLNKRGKRDAPVMADLIASKYPNPEHLYSSTANRALTTCRAFQKALDFTDELVTTTADLYHATIADCLKVIHKIDENIDIAAIFGHNPTFTYLIDELTRQGPDNLPTTGCALVTSDASDWSMFETSNCKLEEYLYPKQFFDK